MFAAVKEKLELNGYANVTATASSVVFEGPTTASGQRWSGYCSVGKQGSQRSYYTSISVGEGVSGTSHINSSGNATPLNNGNYNRQTNHNIWINGDTTLQLFITKRAVILRIIGRDAAYASSDFNNTMIVYALGKTTGEFGSKDFILCSGPQSKIVGRWYYSTALGTPYRSYNGGAPETNTKILKYDTAGNKSWANSRSSENGFYGKAGDANSEGRYMGILSKMKFPDSMTTVMMPMYIRSGGELYGELDSMRAVPMTYYNTGGSFTLNSKKWLVCSTTEYRADNNAHMGFALRED
ncbi:hypothetical protein F862_gp045 [Vibrio phage vB_VpaS_MAR10]|uniref:Uncharacterized protein n=1 Tax=Vibrio phage vB_VpaS_MAR10 TaxID=1229755 RepID=K7RFJ5_9CAUD|nr:hypothetical protein F862_gp045 [Vibrio phage vB_VpaS_MAR10]AFV81277.1 hypothetical protein MAR10_044 [Vibrio phage vB_VpaS_MAR10]